MPRRHLETGVSLNTDWLTLIWPFLSFLLALAIGIAAFLGQIYVPAAALSSTKEKHVIMNGSQTTLNGGLTGPCES